MTKACIDGWVVFYLTVEQLSINAHQKKILLATSNQYIQPTSLRLSSSGCKYLAKLNMIIQYPYVDHGNSELTKLKNNS